MLSDKEKKIGIWLLIGGAIILMVFVVINVLNMRATRGLRGNGVATGGTTSVVNMTNTPAVFYDGGIGEDRLSDPLSAAAVQGYYRQLAYEDSGDAAVAEALEEYGTELELLETMDDEIDWSDIQSRMTSSYWSSWTKYRLGEILPSDDKSLTSVFVPTDGYVDTSWISRVVPNANTDLYDKVNILLDGGKCSGNSLDVLQSYILETYKEGTYCILRLNSEDITCVAGSNIWAAALLDDFSDEELKDYLDNGLTLEDLTANDRLSLVAMYSGEDADGEVLEYYDTAYDACGIHYDTPWTGLFNATEELMVIHNVNGTICVECYAVGDVVDYLPTDEEPEVLVDEEGNEYVEESTESVPLFTGYYCW